MFCPNCAAPCKEHDVPDWTRVFICDPCQMLYEKTGVGIFAFPFADILWTHMPAEVQPAVQAFDPFAEAKC